MCNLCDQVHGVQTYLPQLGGLRPLLTSRISSRSSHPRLSLSMAHRDRGIRTPTSVVHPSALPASVQPLDQPQEDALPRVPRQQPVDQPPSTPHDLARHLDERRAVRRELHPQQRSSLLRVLGSVPRGDRDQQGAPGLEAPRQRAHHHVRPVTDQVVHRGRQRVNAPLELGDQVLLVAAIVGREHDLLGRHRRDRW